MQQARCKIPQSCFSAVLLSGTWEAPIFRLPPLLCLLSLLPSAFLLPPDALLNPEARLSETRHQRRRVGGSDPRGAAARAARPAPLGMTKLPKMVSVRPCLSGPRLARGHRSRGLSLSAHGPFASLPHVRARRVRHRVVEGWPGGGSAKRAVRERAIGFGGGRRGLGVLGERPSQCERFLFRPR